MEGHSNHGSKHVNGWDSQDGRGSFGIWSRNMPSKGWKLLFCFCEYAPRQRTICFSDTWIGFRQQTVR